ncbi:MAG: hypothetical protein ABI969_12580 [bacterium]
MNRFQRRRCTSVAFTFVAFVALACSKGDAPAKDSAMKVAGSPAASRAGAPRVMPGALTKPVADYTGDEFADFVRKLQYMGGAERERKCKNDPGCGATKNPKRTKVSVDAVATQDSISAGTVPPFGVVYIRAINKGDAEEARYGLKPGPTLEYYSIILPDSAGGMKWQIEMFDKRTKQHAPAGSGTFRSCDHAWVAGAKADFKTCANAAAKRDSTVKLGLALQGIDDDPMWASCSTGCCVVDK